jgi:hypothetical protein
MMLPLVGRSADPGAIEGGDAKATPATAAVGRTSPGVGWRYSGVYRGWD